MASGTRIRWGLVLSGGAACGLANVGVLEVLHEAGLRPGCVAGSSMGAIVASLYATGHPPSVLRELAGSIDALSVARLSQRPFKGGLHGGLLQQELDRHLAPLLGDARIGECEIPFVCVAARILRPVRWQRMLLPGFADHVRENLALHIFPTETRILDAVRASSAIPVLFSPARVDGEEFVDLMHFGPIPARSLREVHGPEIVIATDTQPVYTRLEPWLPPGLKAFIAEGRSETQLSLDACDLVIRPPLPAPMFRFDLGEAFAAAGAEETRQRLAEIHALLQ
jgi:NTE family protein